MEQLKLAALDREDLEILSAQVQDAVLKVGDIRYLPREGKLVLAMNRFAWDKLPGDTRSGTRRQPLERRRSALSFARISNLKASRIRREDKDAVLSLLAIEYSETDAPAGHVVLHFSGGGALAFDVECIEAQLADLGAAWATEHMPHHEGTS
ncbi:DUF2948 family protein [Stappia sp. F7233]|uniref:DUF2948 family protein n=1 Tax=Stappia albiluteola TaxID=2758565 RepID=A0A839AGE7_9HYPH|nr:DUF2948 family protein [Stappia albiluteola]MBA5778215.1 DUF2948 family protein [Stappia albiluteola]